MLYKVVGFSRKLKLYDKYHLLLKDQSTANKDVIRKSHHKLTLEFQDLVLTSYQSAKKSVEKWEREFFKIHGVLPSNEDFRNDNIFNTYKQYVMANTLLKNWKVKLPNVSGV